MELNKLYNMDCLEGMKQIPDGSVDAIICDLPYGTTDNKWDSIIPLDKLWAQYKRIIKPNGAICLFGVNPFTASIVISNPKWYKYDWIWQKEKGVGFQLAKFRPMMMTEIVSVFCKTTPKYNPQMIKLDNPVKIKYKAGSNGKSDTSPLRHSREWTAEYTESYPVNVLPFARDRDEINVFHPTQKPVDLLRYLVRTYSNEGDIILDNCMGSGTTAVACIKEKRNFIGFELNKEYYEKACQRIDAEKRQLTLF